MSKGKEKVIEIDDTELDFLPNLLADSAFDPGIPLDLVLRLVLRGCPPK